MPEDIQETPSSTPNFKTELAKQLQELVPEAVADGKVDVEKLKELLGNDADDGSERFGLFWPGKLRAIRAAQEPTTATFAPEPEKSKDWDTTKNVFIEGDNLESLKILQKHYHGKIKMIYIDPPYNTGKDFVYPDNYKEGLKTYLEWTKQVNEEGQKVKSNSETDGRYHSNWLNMMYPRLKLARSLLSDDGVIFISISDEESAHLKKICDEIYGEQNFIGTVVWNSTKSVTNTALISVSHTYNLIYARNIDYFVKNRSSFRLQDSDEGFSNPDNDPRGPWKADPFQVGGWRPNQQYEVVNPNTGQKYLPNPGSSWKNEYTKYRELLKDGRIVFGASGNAGPQRKRFLSEALERGRVSKTLWDDVSTTTNATQSLKKLFDDNVYFDTPKPVDLISRMLELGGNRNAIILDFFSGSGTTAHAVMQLNAEDGGNRKHIQVQLPEPVDPSSAAGQAGFKTIADIARKRIDLAGKKIKKDYAEQLAKRDKPLDVGYRTYRLTDTNFAKWHESSKATQGTLEEHLLSLRDSANDDATELALLTETLLKQGYSLTEKVEKQSIGDLDVYSIGENDLALAYMNESVKPSLDQLRALVDREPEKLIILEDAFQGDDELKTNLVQLAKTKHVELWTA